jgi:hypothetical protein
MHVVPLQATVQHVVTKRRQQPTHSLQPYHKPQCQPPCPHTPQNKIVSDVQAANPLDEVYSTLKVQVASARCADITAHATPINNEMR